MTIWTTAIAHADTGKNWVRCPNCSYVEVLDLDAEPESPKEFDWVIANVVLPRARALAAECRYAMELRH